MQKYILLNNNNKIFLTIPPSHSLEESDVALVSVEHSTSTASLTSPPSLKMKITKLNICKSALFFKAYKLINVTVIPGGIGGLSLMSFQMRNNCVVNSREFTWSLGIDPLCLMDNRLKQLAYTDMQSVGWLHLK